MQVVHDVELADRIAQMVTVLNAGSFLRLFKNDFTPAPNDVGGAFTEADFPGYAAVDLTGDWTAAAEEVNGRYESHTSFHTFEWTGAPTQIVYGYYITTGAGVVRRSERFTTPFTFQAGAETLTFRVFAKHISESIL